MEKTTKLSTVPPNSPEIIPEFEKGLTENTTSPINVNDPLKPYLHRHKCFLDFSPFSSLGEEFIKKIADVTSKLLNTYKPDSTQRIGSPKNWTAIQIFLNWLLINLHVLFPIIALKLKQNDSLSDKEWQSTVNTFRSALIAPSNANTITSGGDSWKNTIIYSLRSCFEHWAQCGILPRVIIRAIQGTTINRRNVKGLAERPRKKDLPEDVKRILDEVLSKDTGGTLATKAQKNDFIQTLFSESNYYIESSDDPLSGLIDLNNRRLQDLRNAMEEVLLNHYEIFKKGKELLYTCDISYEEDILPALTEYIKGNQPRPSKLTLLFSKAPTKEMALARFLTLIVGRWDGIVASETGWELNSFINFTIRNNLFISKDYLSKLLVADREALIAGYAILLIDTGNNVADIAHLTSDCLRDTNDPNLMELYSNKGRSGNKITLAYLNVTDNNRISGVKVIDILLEMTERYRKVPKGEGSCPWKNPILTVTDQDVKYKLFIQRMGLNTLYSGIYSANKIFRRICGNYDSLKGIHLSFDAIRPSVQLKKFFEGNLDAGIAQTNLQHTNKVKTTGYVMRFVSKLVLEREMRRFMDQFEAVMIADIPKAAEILGYLPDEFQELLSTALRNGLGCVCLRSIIQHNISKDSLPKCNIIEECNDCQYMRIAVASKENLVDAILIDKYLEQNCEEMIAMNKMRFDTVWCPTWARVKATIELAKISPSVSRQLFADAHAMAEQIGIHNLPPMF